MVFILAGAAAVCVLGTAIFAWGSRRFRIAQGGSRALSRNDVGPPLTGAGLAAIAFFWQTLDVEPDTKQYIAYALIALMLIGGVFQGLTGIMLSKQASKVQGRGE